jgi:large subunit ribosomal protein L30
MSNKKVNITLLRSPHHGRPNHRANLRALGLRKIGVTKSHTLTPVIQGMIKKVYFMIKVEDAS